MNRWLISIPVIAAVLAAGGCVDRTAQSQAKATQKIVSDPTQVVSVIPVAARSVSETLEITGELTTSQDASVAPKTSGRLVAVYVKDGDPVAAGQLIASQDTTALEAQLRQALAGLSTAASQLSQALANARYGPSKSAAAVSAARAQLKSAQANLKKVREGARKEERIQADWQVKQAKTNMEVAKADFDRKTTLQQQGAIPKNQLEQAQNAYMAAQTQYNAALQSQSIQATPRPEDIQVAESAAKNAEELLSQAKSQQQLDVLYNDQVAGAKAAVAAAQAQVDVAKQAIADAQIKAPFAGRVSGKPAQPGSVAGPSTTVARIIGAGSAYFEGQVPESEVNKVQPGSPVTITMSALPGKTFSGHVAAINPLGSDVGRLFTARVAFETVNPDIKPGMFARGAITLRTIPNAIMVPATAVVPYLSQQVVFVMVGTDKVKPLPVQTGLRQGDLIQITNGLAPGEKLVVRGQESLNDKSKVRIEANATAATGNGAVVGERIRGLEDWKIGVKPADDPNSILQSFNPPILESRWV